MKSSYALLPFLSILFITRAAGQNSTPASQVAIHIADKMRDSLSLTITKRDQILSINTYLANLKSVARQQTANPDSLRFKLQKIENKRDSLYHTVLAENKFQLYLQKKKNLISTN